MDGAGKVLEDVPDPVSEVKVERVEVMNFGDGMYMVAFQHHGEESGFKDAEKYAGVENGIERYYFRGGREGRSRDMGLHRHGRIIWNVKGSEFEWCWRNWKRWHTFIYQGTIFGGNTGDAGRIP